MKRLLLATTLLLPSCGLIGEGEGENLSEFELPVAEFDKHASKFLQIIRTSAGEDKILNLSELVFVAGPQMAKLAFDIYKALSLDEE
jgi:hypothetical protein